MAERKVVPFDEFYYQLKLMISETPCIKDKNRKALAENRKRYRKNNNK
jgi:hypothetical protein